MRTTATNGVIIGTNPNDPNWTLRVADGMIEFSVFDGQNVAAATSERRSTMVNGTASRSFETRAADCSWSMSTASYRVRPAM